MSAPVKAGQRPRTPTARGPPPRCRPEVPGPRRARRGLVVIAMAGAAAPVHNGRVTRHPTKGIFDISRAQWQRAEGAEGLAGQIEIAFVDDLIGMRDGADPDGPVPIFTQPEWEAFVGGVEDGEFDL